ncbi:MAG: hypothetical protein Q4C03_07400, partial [bacterium]|nr:hypothetical protein [bacterium]
MKRSLIRKLGLALLALITPALAWAADPTPVLLLDFGDKKTVSDNTDGWQTLAELTDVGASSKVYSVKGKDAKTYTVTHEFAGAGKVWKTGEWSGSFSADANNSFTSPDKSQTYTSALAEMKETLGLQVEVPSGIWNDASYSGHGGDRTQKITITGFDTEKCYTLYFIGAFTDTDSTASPTPRFQLTTYNVEKAPVLSWAKHTSTQYATADVTSSVTGDTWGGIIARVHNLYADSTGTLVVTVASNKSPVSAIALAETDYVEALTAIEHTRSINTASDGEAWSDTDEWTNQTLPNAAAIVNLTADV